MTTLSIYVCPGANQTVSSDGAPQCTDGAGSWQNVEIAEPFDITQLSAAEMGECFGASFVILSTFLLTVAGAKAVGRSVSGGEKN